MLQGQAPAEGAQGFERTLGLAPELPFSTTRPIDIVRIGYVGVGLQGSSHFRNLLRIEGAEIAALCDSVPEKVTRVCRAALPGVVCLMLFAVASWGLMRVLPRGGFSD